MGIQRNKDLDYLTFPILAAISKSPATLRELTKRLLMSRSNVARRLRQLQEQGLIVQRMDRKWQALVTLRMESVPNITAQGVLKDKGEPVGPAVIKGQAPEIKAEAPKDPEWHDGTYASNASPNAKLVSKTYNVPVRVRKYGEAVSGKRGRCIACKNTTPLRYGSTHMCPPCARREAK